MKRIIFYVLCFIGISALAAVAVERERDTANRNQILRWYTWGKKGGDGKFERCEGRLEYDIEVPQDGWYALEQQGMPCGWDRTIYIDNRVEFLRLKTNEQEIPEGSTRQNAWHKELNLFLTRGKHTLSYERTGFPGCFPVRWRLVNSDGTARGTIRVNIVQDVLFSGDEMVMEVTAGTTCAMDYELVAVSRSNGQTNLLTTVKFAPTPTPQKQTVRIKAPAEQGVYCITVREKGCVGWKADTGANYLITIDPQPTPCGKELKKTLVVDIDCVKEAPYVERDGATKIVKTCFGTYRESSGNASNSHYALDGFSYYYTLPDIRHTYLLEVTYPDDKFRSLGFWSNNAGKDGKNENGREGGQVLTGGVETGGQYRNTMKMLTHEAFFYPTTTNMVLAVVNLNRGSRAAASRIRVYRIDDALPAAPAGARRGRLAGAFFEEYGRWKRFFGLGNDPNPMHCEEYDDLRTMERWAEWNRFAGVNLMAPAVVAYANILYPSKVIDGNCVQTLNELRMLALVAAKYGNSFVPHITLHGDQSFDKRMGIEKKDGKMVFADPDVIEWANDGSTKIPWRDWCYNCLHPKVQQYLLDVVGEVADMIGDVKSFDGLSLRIPLSWQFSGITGLNNAKYGYGDWTMRELAKSLSAAEREKLLLESREPSRFKARYEFLMSSAMHDKWMKWRNDRIKEYYRKVRARLNKNGGEHNLYFVWWESSGSADEMNECGIDPNYWRDEPGISFCGNQVLYGRRYFAPRSLFDQQYRMYNEQYLKMSRIGRRSVGIYSSYYEPNNELFDWSKFGGAPYTAFDALEPAGDYERQLYAMPLAQVDAGVFFNGGNGWIFGTPAKTRDFMREYLALPAARFTEVSGVAQDPVTVRELVTPEGRFVYFVNGIDSPVAVKFTATGEVVSAADGKKAAQSFTLPAYGLKSVLIKGGGAVSSVQQTSTPEAKNVYARQVATLDKLRTLAKERKVGVELRRDIYDEAMGAATAAVEGFASGRLMQVAGAVCNPKLVYLYDLIGRYPAGLFASHPHPIGGYPASARSKPQLKFSRVWGGVPTEAPAASSAIWSATDGRRTWLSFMAGARGQLREFDAQGKYLRSGVLTHFEDNSYNEGDSWHGFLRDPSYLNGEALLWTNGVLYAAQNKVARKYNVDDFFREELTAIDERPPLPSAPPECPIKLQPLEQNFVTPSQLKVQNGKLLFAGSDGIYSFDPTSGKRELVQKVSGDFVFDVTPKGKLVTGSIKGGVLYKQTDLLAFDDGSIIRRCDPWDHLKFERVKAEGQEKKEVFDFDYRDFRQGNRFGFCRDKNGVMYVAGAGSRRVAAYSAAGALLWERKWRPAQATELGDLPLRCPSSCTVDAKGRLWVTDFAADHLVALDAKTGRFIGTWGYSGTLDDTTGFGFSAITGIAYLNNCLYVLDSGNLRLIELKIKD